VLVLVDMVNSPRIYQTSAAFYAVDEVAFSQQELREVGSVLTGDTGNQSHFLLLYRFCFYHSVMRGAS